MSDTEQAASEKRSPGRPRGSTSKRHVKPPPQRKPDFDPDYLENFEYSPDDAPDRLGIDKDILTAIKQDWGYITRWICFECMGQPTPDHVSLRMRNGFAEIRRGNFGGLLDHLCDKDGRIVRTGLVLMARPIEIERKGKAAEARKANDQKAQNQRSHQLEGVNVGGGDHPSALRQNRQRSTFEPGPSIPPNYPRN
jgi:hypothetical protein